MQRIARVASVAGRRVGHPLLQAASGLGDAEVEEALREAVTHHVLVADAGDRYAFRHALLQEAVYGDLLPGERVRLHGTYARLLAGGVEGSAAELAYHSLESRDLPGALTASVQAATEAAELHAPAEALRHLEEALQLWHAVPDADARAGCDLVSIGLRAAAAAASSGEPHRAVALGRATLERVDQDAPGSVQAAVVRQRLAVHLLNAGLEDEGYVLTAQALAMLPEDAPSAARAWAATTHARAAINVDDDAEAVRWAKVAVAAARALDLADVESDALATLALASEMHGDPEAAQEQLATASERAVTAGDVGVELRIRYNLAASHFYSAELPAALRTIDESVARAGAVGLTYSAYGLELRVLQVIARYMAGDWDGSGQAAELAGDGTPDAVIARLAAAALYVEVGRGRPGAMHRVEQLRGAWGQDTAWRWSPAAARPTCCAGAATWTGRRTRPTARSSM